MSRRVTFSLPRLLLLAIVIAIIAWRHWHPAGGARPAPSAGTPVALRVPAPAAPEPRRDLALDEARGGHTLARHVGRTDAQLRERLAREEISAASSFTDRATAERAVGAALAANERLLRDWLSRDGDDRPLALDWAGDGTTIGRSLRRGAPAAEPCTAVRILLRRAAPDYFVLTAYPETGR